MAAGLRNAMGTAHENISTTQAGPVLKMAAIANLAVTATTGSLPTADGAVVIANTATPTVVELLEYCVELETKLEALLAAMRTSGALTS